VVNFLIYEIPAFAGMTKEETGMTDQIPAFAGLTLVLECKSSLFSSESLFAY
jgi:hypothetical protein